MRKLWNIEIPVVLTDANRGIIVSRMYLISAYFDDKTNRILQGYMKRIAAKTGNSFMMDNHVPPHMTISSIEARSVEILRPAFLGLQGQIRQGRIQFVSVGQLLPYVMYATPVLNEYLLDVSGRVYEAVKTIPMTEVSKYYRPLSWLPHVTLAKKLDKGQMLTALEVLWDGFVPFEATITEMGLSKVNPHEDVERMVLSK